MVASRSIPTIHDDISKSIRHLSDLASFDAAELDPRGYREGYCAIEQLFASNVRLDDRPSVLAAALVIYGWMPRILGCVDWSKLERAKATLESLRGITNRSEAMRSVRELPEVTKAASLTFVNNSVVGTSKFLHFWNPECFPIWDRRVARCFGITAFSAVNNSERYLEFLQEMNDALDADLELPEKYVEFLNEHRSTKVTPMRSLEYALFLCGGQEVDGTTTA